MVKIFFSLFALLPLVTRFNAKTCLTVTTLLLVLVAVPVASAEVPSSAFFLLDGLSGPLLLLTLWLLPLMLLASPQGQVPKKALFLVTMLALTVSMLLAFSASQALLFYLAFEAAVLPASLLILSWGGQPERWPASLYLVLYTVSASLPFLLILFSLQASNHHLSFLLPLWSGVQGVPQGVWWTLLLLPFLVKAPLYGAHLWLPKAHVEAPVAGSMALAGLLLKLGGFGILRFSPLFPHTDTAVASPLSGLALWGAVLASLVCLRQTDLKALIAYSSVAHMGLLLAGALSNTAWGWEGALLLSLAHGLSSPALFVLVTLSYVGSGSRSLFLTRGVLTISPLLAAGWAGGLFTNLGVPPAINLPAEILLIGSVLGAHPVAGVVLAFLLVLSAGYTLHLYSVVTHGNTLSSGSYAMAHPLSARAMLLLGLHLVPLVSLFLAMDHFLWYAV